MTYLQIEEALTKNFPDHNVVQFLGTASVRDQLNLFSRAAMIIAPHGAGLSNMIVSPLHTPVLEIGPPGCSVCYLHLSLKVRTNSRTNQCTCHIDVTIIRPAEHTLGLG